VNNENPQSIKLDDVEQTLDRVERGPVVRKDGKTPPDQFLFVFPYQFSGNYLPDNHEQQARCGCAACAENAARPTQPRLACGTDSKKIPESSIPRTQYGTYEPDGHALRAAGLGHLWRPAEPEVLPPPKPYDELSPWLQKRILAKIAGNLKQHIAKEAA
jgi:hypothetical protein